MLKPSVRSLGPVVALTPIASGTLALVALAALHAG